jgi:tRNA(Ile)-lysidine synthase
VFSESSAPGLGGLDRRLDPRSAAPIAVAFSGGGDSLAALLVAKLWGDQYGRRLIALHVDHRLQAASGDWSRACPGVCDQLGLGFRRLPWLGDKPDRGLPAAARRARHDLLAAAASEVGARVIIFGHTADDEQEAELMRAEGASLGPMAEWRPSPAWPTGRGLFVLRPLLGVRRAALRAWLSGQGLSWIDDPANDDPRWPRARARARLAQLAPLQDGPIDTPDDPALATLARAARFGLGGDITIDRSALTSAPPATRRRFLSAALTCAGGGERPPRGDRLAALADRVASREPVIATLNGAKLVSGDLCQISRETGAYRRHGAPVVVLEPGQAAVWDGRFEVVNRSDLPITIRHLAGQAATLPPDQRAKLRKLPSEVRGGLPAASPSRGPTTCPMLNDHIGLTAKSLVADRLLGVCGVFSKESAL